MVVVWWKYFYIYLLVQLLWDVPCKKEPIPLLLPQQFDKKTQMHPSPQNDVVANRLLSKGGAHLAHIPWQAG